MFTSEGDIGSPPPKVRDCDLHCSHPPQSTGANSKPLWRPQTVEEDRIYPGELVDVRVYRARVVGRRSNYVWVELDTPDGVFPVSLPIGVCSLASHPAPDGWVGDE